MMQSRTSLLSYFLAAMAGICFVSGLVVITGGS